MDDNATSPVVFNTSFDQISLTISRLNQSLAAGCRLLYIFEKYFNESLLKTHNGIL